MRDPSQRRPGTRVINAALETREADAQLMTAELLYRNACTLDINNALHWPSSINSTWIPPLPVTAKLLIVDALVHMALASSETANSLRELAVRLYGVSAGDRPERVKGCVGTLLTAIMPAVRKLGYKDFMKGPEVGFVTLDEMEKVARKASPNPDGYFERARCDRQASSMFDGVVRWPDRPARRSPRPCRSSRREAPSSRSGHWFSTPTP